MHERFQDAMTYVRNFGKPDLFITFTANGNWKEIKNQLEKGQQSYDRQDIIARVFRLKLKKKLLKVIIKMKAFGPVRCHMYSIQLNGRKEAFLMPIYWLGWPIKLEQMA